MSRPPFNYNPEKLDRELCPNYIPASSQDIDEMLESLNLKSIDELYSHLHPSDLFSKEEFYIEGIKEYEDLAEHVYQISKKNITTLSFIGDGLTHYKPSPIINEICSIRGLTTAYTPYQPERSQGTLQSLWIYQSILSEMTGFEAINASLYERSTGIFEAIKCALRIKRKNVDILVIDSLYPGDKEVLKTLCEHTDINLKFMPLDSETAQANLESLNNYKDAGVLVFSQTTNLGTLEEVNQLTDFASKNNMISIAVIDPILLGNGGLKKPSVYGSEKQGVDIIVGEAQNLALDKNFGGPGLGIFGVRYHQKQKLHIRQTPGRFVGETQDLNGKTCKSIILSTREQHIRREKATSNICSNQSFVATLAGANLLHWGSEGLAEKIATSRNNTLYVLDEILKLTGVNLAFNAPFFNEVTLKLNQNVQDLIDVARKENLEIGIDVSTYLNDEPKLKVFVNDTHLPEDLEKLINFFKSNFKNSSEEKMSFNIPSEYSRTQNYHVAQHSSEKVISYYHKLGSQNLSPDDGIYPLGSCTMKYNPYINDYCASLKGFTTTHPQTHEKFVQGNLEILFEIQEFFKRVTGLPGVTTQPVAGAQGELVGLKLFQAYHKSLNQERDIIIIPKSAHGTNPATAFVAGYKIEILKSLPDGQIDLNHLEEIIKLHQEKIAGIMVTNPNTSGVFEQNFRSMAKIIHREGGLVYMDGANMNAIAGIVNLNSIGVDAVHNNLHKTWTIPHGGGGPGDAIVAVSEKLIDFLPGVQISKDSNNYFSSFKPKKSIGSFHRHWGNFAHKVRCYTYIKALGSDGIRKMAQYAVLSARYLFHQLKNEFPTLPFQGVETPRMHEFIITLSEETFENIEQAGVQKSLAISRVGKLFLDFGFHAPTVAFPETYGLMIEPTESFDKKELDQFLETLLNISTIIKTHPQVLNTVPHFTPVTRVDELSANRHPKLREESVNDKLFEILEEPLEDSINPSVLKNLSAKILEDKIKMAHQELL